MKCMSCGAQIPDNADFCTNCGERQEFNKTLIDGAMRGDTQAETKLYNATYNHVYALIKSMIKDEDTVLDLLQDSYVKAFRSLQQLQEANKFRPWLKTIAKNRTMDYFRERKQLLFSDMTALDDEDASADFEDTNPDAMPDVVMDRQETARLLAEILDSLPDDQRGVISMFYYGQMSVKEIASALGLNEKTVSSRLIYGRNKIKTQVLELEKRGTKLYGLAPLPFLLFLLRKNEAHAMADAAASVSLAEILRQTGHAPHMSAQEAGREASGQGTQTSAAQGGTEASGQTANASAPAAAQGTAPASFATGSAAGAAAAAGGGLGAAKIAAIVIAAVAIVGGGTTAGILAYRHTQEERAQIAQASATQGEDILSAEAGAEEALSQADERLQTGEEDVINAASEAETLAQAERTAEEEADSEEEEAAPANPMAEYFHMTMGEVIEQLGENYEVVFYEGERSVWYEDQHILVVEQYYDGLHDGEYGTDQLFVINTDNNPGTILYTGDDEVLPGVRRDTMPNITAQLDRLGIEYETYFFSGMENISGEDSHGINFVYQGIRYNCSWGGTDPDVTVCDSIGFFPAPESQ